MLVQGLSASNIAVAGRLGIHEGQILQQLSGRSARLRTGNAKAAAAGVCQDHARFALACMLNELLCEVPAWLVAEEWGPPQKLSAAGTWWFPLHTYLIGCWPRTIGSLELMVQR